MRAKNSGALMSLKPRTVKNPRNSPVLPFGTLKSSLAKSVVSQLHERTCEFSDGHSLGFLGEFDSRYGTALKEWGKQVANLQRLSGPGRIMLPSLPDVNLLLLTLLIPVALVHLAVFALCVFLSIVSLRAGAVRLELPGRSLPQRVRIDEASWGPFEEPKEFSVHQPAPTVIWSHRPPVTDQALLWKEA